MVCRKAIEALTSSVSRDDFDVDLLNRSQSEVERWQSLRTVTKVGAHPVVTEDLIRACLEDGDLTLDSEFVLRPSNVQLDPVIQALGGVSASGLPLMGIR